MQNAPGLDREEPELGYEDDIPTPANDDEPREDPQADPEAGS
jgi:hypothetical protein